MSPQPDITWQDFLNALQKVNIEADLAARYGKNNNIGVLSGGGRLGINYPINNTSSFGVGVTGEGYVAKGNTPYGSVNEKDFRINNVDLRYINGNNTFSGGFGINGNPNWNFNYERKF